MLGYDDEELEEVVKRSRWAWVRVLLLATEIGVGTVLTVGLLGTWLLFTPEGFRRVVPYLFAADPLTVTFEDLEVLPTTDWLAPETWAVAFSHVDIVPDDPSEPRFHLDRVIIPLPDPRRALLDREIHFPWARVIGFHIEDVPKPYQEWQPKPSVTLIVDHLEVEDWSYHRPERTDLEPPMPAMSVERIYGTFADGSYHFGARRLSGHAALTARRFVFGESEAVDLVLPAVTVQDSRLDFGAGADTPRFTWVGTPARMNGTIEPHLFRRGKITINVSIEDAPFAEAVLAATGSESPVLGRLDANLTFHSAGDLADGEEYWEGEVAVRQTVMPLRGQRNDFVRDLVGVFLADVDDRDRARLGDMKGSMRFENGKVTIHELRYVQGGGLIDLRKDRNNIIAVKGWVGVTQFDLIFRVLPQRQALTLAGNRRGVAWQLSGPIADPRFDFALSIDQLRSQKKLRNP